MVDGVRKLEEKAFVRGNHCRGCGNHSDFMGYVQPCVIMGKFFPREVEIRLENISGYGRICQATLDFVLRNDAFDKHGNGDFRIFQRGKTDEQARLSSMLWLSH